MGRQLRDYHSNALRSFCNYSVLESSGAGRSDVHMAALQNSVDFSRSTILLVDDNDFFSKLIEVMLRALEVRTIITVNTADSAFEHTKKRHIDCMITDWSIDTLDGLALTKRIRTHKETLRPDMPIIVCSAHTELERVIAARDAGVTEFLAKPISAAHLYDKLAHALFSERLFISEGAYVGPDRRRRKENISIRDRRRDLNQQRIDEVMQMGAA